MSIPFIRPTGTEQPDVGEPLLLLGVHPHVVAPVAAGELLAGRDEVEAGALGQLVAEALGTELLDQVAHAGQAPVLAVAELAEELGDRPGDLDRLVHGSRRRRGRRPSAPRRRARRRPGG